MAKFFGNWGGASNTPGCKTVRPREAQAIMHQPAEAISSWQVIRLVYRRLSNA